jgi:ABC-2 type transport system permease protein
MNLRRPAAALGAIVVRDLRIFLSYRFRLVSVVLGPAVLVIMFYYVSRLVKVESLGSSDGYFSFVITGMAALAVLTAAVSEASSTLRTELVAGTFERLAASAYGPLRACIAMIVFPVLQAIFVAALTIFFATIIGNLHLRWDEALLALPAALLVAVAFAPLGLLVVALSFVIRQTTSGITLLMTIFSVLAGVYFPVELLPAWVRWTSEVQPFTPAVGLLRHLLSEAPMAGSPWTDVAKLVGFTVVLFPVSLMSLRAAISFARRRGTILEY